MTLSVFFKVSENSVTVIKGLTYKNRSKVLMNRFYKKTVSNLFIRISNECF